MEREDMRTLRPRSQRGMAAGRSLSKETGL